MLTSTGDGWGRWGQSMTMRVRHVPTVRPQRFGLGTAPASRPIELSPLLMSGDRSGDALTAIDTGTSPLSPVVPIVATEVDNEKN